MGFGWRRWREARTWGVLWLVLLGLLLVVTPSASYPPVVGLWLLVGLAGRGVVTALRGSRPRAG